MWLGVGKIVIAAVLISFVSWLSGKKTGLAGFLTALPLTTLLALAFSHAEWGDTKQSVAYAKSVFVAIPVSLLFFIPFFLADKFQLNFWTCYATGIVLLGVGYFVHDYLARVI